MATGILPTIAMKIHFTQFLSAFKIATASFKTLRFTLELLVVQREKDSLNTTTSREMIVIVSVMKNSGRILLGSVGVSSTPIILTKNQPEIIGPTIPKTPAANDSQTSMPFALSQLARQLPQIVAQLCPPTPPPNWCKNIPSAATCQTGAEAKAKYPPARIRIPTI